MIKIAHFRRRYELLSFLMNFLAPISLVVVVALQGQELIRLSKELEALRQDVDTMRIEKRQKNAIQINWGRDTSSTAASK